MKTKVKVLLLFFIILCTVGIPSVYAKIDNSRLKDETQITKEELELDDVYRISENEDGTVDIVGINKMYSDIYYEGETTLKFPDSINGKNVRFIRFKIKSLGDFTKIEMPAGTTQIVQNVFSNCDKLEEVVLPDTVTVINENAFYRCTNLKKINIPENLSKIKDLAFAGCTSLTKIDLPDKLTTMGLGAFQNCSKIKKINISDKITVIEDSTFEGCSSLEEVELGSKVEKIKSFAFNNCDSLTKVTIHNSKAAISQGAFKRTEKLTIYGHKVSTAKTYATNNNINFVALPETMTSAEKAGILMSSFLTQCVEKYGNRIQYGTKNRHINVFYKQPELGSLSLVDSLDCVGCLNLYIYQSTGLWSKNFGAYNGALQDELYLGPKNQNSKLKATDLFEYIGGTSNTNGYTFSTLKECAQNGTLKPGDLLTMNNHVAMYAGWNGSKMLIGENHDKINAWSNFTSGTINWPGQNISVARIKEEAADMIPGLAELNMKEEIEAYGRALADAYFNGSTTYNGQTLYRKVYYQTHIMVGDSVTPDLTLKNKNVKASDGTYKSIKIAAKCKGLTVKQMKEKMMASKNYIRVDILDKDGNVILDDNTKITTGMKARGYKAKATSTVGASQVAFAVGEEETEDEEIEEYNTVVYGDVTGKGEPGAIDALAIVKNNTGKISLENEVYEEAGRVTKKTRENDLIPSSVDAYYISASKLGRCEIEQGDFDDIEIIEEDGTVIPLYTREDLENVGSGEEYISKTTQETYIMETDAKYVLMADIDLSDREWTPLGKEATDESESTIITNAFDGNDHKITGLRINVKEDDPDGIGLFSICKAKISNLTMEAPAINSAYSKKIGVVAGRYVIDNNTSGLLLNNVKVLKGNSNENGIIYSGDNSFAYYGGIVGLLEKDPNLYNNDAVYYIYNCENEMNLQANSGLIGYVNASQLSLQFSECSNSGNLNCTRGYAGGIIGSILSGNLIMSECENNGEITIEQTSTNACGGLIGKVYVLGESIIINNNNRGNVLLNDLMENIGGIIGEYNGGICIAANNTNSGNISGIHYIGGIFGVAGASKSIIVFNCENSGITSGISNVGGIIGDMHCLYEDEVNGCIMNCTNVGNQVFEYKTTWFTGGILGEATGVDIFNCINRGSRIINNVNFDNGYCTGTAIGGIVGRVYNANIISNCVNGIENNSESMLNYANEQVGGIVGSTDKVAKITGCKNYQKIKRVSDYITYSNLQWEKDFLIGGIVGFVEDEKNFDTLIENSDNYADINGADYVGGITGVIHNTNIKNCSNSGKISNEKEYVGGICAAAVNSRVEYCNNTGAIKGGNEEACNEAIKYDENGEPWSSTLYTCYVGGICGVSRDTYFSNCVSSADLTSDMIYPFIAGITPFVELPEYLDSCSGGGSMTAPHTWKYQCLYVNEADEIFYAGWPYDTRGEGGCKEKNLYVAHKGDVVCGSCERDFEEGGRSWRWTSKVIYWRKY